MYAERLEMRLFTGIAIPQATAGQLQRLVDQLRPVADFRWSPLSNFHITTQFIGEWPEARLEELKHCLDDVRRPEPFRIAVRGLGWFPNPLQPRVLFAGVDGGQTLHDLAGDIHTALEGIGAILDARPYSPHLTLARIGAKASLPGVRQAIAGLDTTDSGEFVADRFHLYLSSPEPAGAVYTQISHFPFAE